jgi:hypothetical protein
MDDAVFAVAFSVDSKSVNRTEFLRMVRPLDFPNSQSTWQRRYLIMKSLLTRFFVILVLLFMVTSCATVSTEQTAPLGPGELRLLGVEFPEFGRIRQNVKYQLNVKFESDGKVEVRRACLYWDRSGPTCFGIIGVNYGERIIRVDANTPASGYYVMKCYVLYVRNGNTIRSNMVESTVEIK